MRASCSTAALVHTLQCPSRPPVMRTVTSLAAAPHRERHQQVEHDVVVVAGVQRHAVFGAGGDHAAHDVERAVAVERRHLDGDHVVDGGEAAPELRRQRDAADRGLQVEADQRNDLRHRRAVCDQFVDRRALHRRRATACRRGSRVRARSRPRGRPARCGPRARRSSPAAASSIRVRCARRARAPARTGRRRGSANCVACTPTARPPAPARCSSA